MWWKYLIEAGFGPIIYSIGLSFWTVFKASRYRRRVLTRSGSLDSFIKHLEPAWIKDQGAVIQPEFGSPFKDILHWLRNNSNAMCIVGNGSLLGVITLIVASYLLGLGFAVFNIIVFFATAGQPLTTATRNDMLIDVQMILLFLYRWNFDNPQECALTISARIPLLNEAFRAIRRIT
jgi:hypothetical protein